MIFTTCFRCDSENVSRLSCFGVLVFDHKRTAAVSLIFLCMFENADIFYFMESFNAY